MPRKKQTLPIRLHNGTEIDWFSLTREQRREMKKRCPDIVKKIESYIKNKSSKKTKEKNDETENHTDTEAETSNS